MNDPDTPPRLTQADQKALDALVEARFDLGKVPADLRQRAERIARFLALLDALPEAECSNLAERTLRRIRQTSHHLEPVASIGRGAVPLRDILAIAAMLVLAISVMWPMLAGSRATARQVGCMSNLGQTNQAMQAYSLDFRGLMPRAKLRAGDLWWFTNRFDEEGHALSNSASLFVLTRFAYLPGRLLRCPENPDAPAEMDPDWRDWPGCDARSYSYQNQYTEHPQRMNRRTLIAVAADQNPNFRHGRYHADLPCEANSPNHQGRGQNVAMNDGSVRWMTKPRLASGNLIYHIGYNGYEDYQGREAPADEGDSFLGQ